MKTNFFLLLLFLPNISFAQYFNETYDFSDDYRIDQLLEDTEGFNVGAISSSDILIFLIDVNGVFESSFKIPLVDAPANIPVPAHRVQYNDFINYDLVDNIISMSRWNGLGDFLWDLDLDLPVD